MVHNKETNVLKNNYKSCEWYTKEELPICDGYFKNGVSKILATPTKDKGGKSMSRDGILKLMKLVNSLLVGSGNSFDDQCPIILSFVCQSIISPCNSACQPSKMSSKWCIETITNNCIKESANADISKVNSYFSYTFLSDPQDNEILKVLLNESITHYLNADKTTPMSFCNDQNLFGSSAVLLSNYNCTNRHVIPGSAIFTSNKTIIFRIVYTLFTIVVFAWLSMYRLKYMKQRRHYILSESGQIIGCVIFMIILLIRLIMSMNQLSEDIVFFHIFGMIGMYVSFITVDIICALGGKKPIHANLEHTNNYSTLLCVVRSFNKHS
jgi:hypothetical protein